MQLYPSNRECNMTFVSMVDCKFNCIRKEDKSTQPCCSSWCVDRRDLSRLQYAIPRGAPTFQSRQKQKQPFKRCSLVQQPCKQIKLPLTCRIAGPFEYNTFVPSSFGMPVATPPSYKALLTFRLVTHTTRIGVETLSY